MKLLKIEFLICFCVLSLIQVVFVESACVIQYPENVKTSPVYKKVFGKHRVELPYNGKAIELNEGETIEAFCQTHFSSISYTSQREKAHQDHYYLSVSRYESYTVFLRNQTSINLQCLNTRLYLNNFLLQEIVLECNELKLSIYDTNKTYGWCEKDQNGKTFSLAIKSNQDYHMLAEICFNLNKWSLRTITYNVTNPGQRHNVEMLRDITKTDLQTFQSLGDDLWNLKTIKSFDLTETDLNTQLAEMTESNSWLNLANFEISSVVQGNSYGNYFSEYNNILNTIWWHNLRLGNWKRFMDTLENYAYNNSFQLYTGTSGAVKVPSRNMADFEMLKIKNGFFNVTIPAYIWTYLTSTDYQNEDFIVVGCNSPYAEFLSLGEVEFCPNICSEIPWLKEISKSFRYVTAGILFCCSPEFVKQSNNLQGFPMDVLVERSRFKSSNVKQIDNMPFWKSYDDDFFEERGLLKPSNVMQVQDQNQIRDANIELRTDRLIELQEGSGEAFGF